MTCSNEFKTCPRQEIGRNSFQRPGVERRLKPFNCRESKTYFEKQVYISASYCRLLFNDVALYNRLPASPSSGNKASDWYHPTLFSILQPPWLILRTVSDSSV